LSIGGATKTIEVVKLTRAKASAFAASNERCDLLAVVCGRKKNLSKPRCVCELSAMDGLQCTIT